VLSNPSTLSPQSSVLSPDGVLSPPRKNVGSARSFGRAAEFYDDDERANVLARWTRRQGLRALDSAFGLGDRVLEIGCGTGREAVHLARRGVRVVATDAAPGMIDVLSARLAPGGAAEDLAGMITTLLLPAGKLGTLLEQYGPGAFDGCYSSMGPLNCEPDLQPVASALALLVRPGGRLVLSILNRYCLWETAWYLRARQLNIAFRRWSGRAEATSRPDWQEEVFTCYYWHRRDIERAFRPHFRVVSRRGLPWLLPPLYLDDLIKKAPGFFRVLARLDRRLAAVWPAYDIGDHLLLELIRE
jgi:SAM-dependent methyltransferase